MLPAPEWREVGLWVQARQDDLRLCRTGIGALTSHSPLTLSTPLATCLYPPRHQRSSPSAVSSCLSSCRSSQPQPSALAPNTPQLQPATCPTRRRLRDHHPRRPFAMGWRHLRAKRYLMPALTPTSDLHASSGPSTSVHRVQGPMLPPCCVSRSPSHPTTRLCPLS